MSLPSVHEELFWSMIYSNMLTKLNAISIHTETLTWQHNLNSTVIRHIKGPPCQTVSKKYCPVPHIPPLSPILKPPSISVFGIEH